MNLEFLEDSEELNAFVNSCRLVDTVDQHNVTQTIWESVE